MKSKSAPSQRPRNPTHFGGDGLYDESAVDGAGQSHAPLGDGHDGTSEKARPVQRRDAPESKSDASASAAGINPVSAQMPAGQYDQIAQRAYELAAQRDFRPGHELDDWLQAEREIEAGPARNTPPDNPFDQVKTSSNEEL
jgi:hypothetical protein